MLYYTSCMIKHTYHAQVQVRFPAEHLDKHGIPNLIIHFISYNVEYIEED